MAIPPPAPDILAGPGFQPSAALKHRNYRLFVGGQFVSLIGTWMQSTAQSWLVYRLTGSPAMLGAVSFASLFPVFLFIESIRVVSPMCYPDTSGGRQLRMTPSEAILEAVKAGEEQKVREFLQADPALAGAHGLAGESAILMAAYRGRSDLVELLLAAGPELDIFEASATGQADRVRSLLASEPGLANAAATDGFTPLGLASFFGHAEVAALLLARGAELNAPSKNEMSVMPVSSAAAGRHTAVVKLLLDHGADPNARQRSAFTPLHSAAHNGQVDMVELLLARGADINARSDEGLTPLRLALDRGRTAVAELLRARGAAE